MLDGEGKHSGNQWCERESGAKEGVGLYESNGAVPPSAHGVPTVVITTDSQGSHRPYGYAICGNNWNYLHTGRTAVVRSGVH